METGCVTQIGVEIVPQVPIDNIVDYCKYLEEIGIDIVWFTDHFFNRNPYIVSSIVLRSTSRLHVGVGVSNTYVVHPAYLTSMACTLSELSGGRFILGLGVGDKSTLEMIGIKREKALKRLRESIEIIRGLCSGQVVTYQGEVFNILGAKIAYCRDLNLRIYVGAQAGKTIVLACELADGVLLNASNPEMVKIMLQYVERGLKKRKVNTNFDVVVHLCVSISDDESKAKKAVRPYVAFIAAGLPDEYVEKFNIQDKVTKIREALSKGDVKTASSHVDDQLIDLLSVTGTFRRCVEKIQEVLKLGNINITIGSPIAPSIDEAKKFLKELVHIVKSS